MSFDAQIKKFLKETEIELTKEARRFAGFVYAEAVARSPIDTGEYQASWRIAVNTPDLSVANGKALNTAQQIGKLKQVKPGDTIFVSNNVPYALKLENGHSQQAPLGVLNQAIAAVSAFKSQGTV